MDKKRFFWFLALLSSFCCYCFAEDVRVEINGAILEQSCNVSSNDLVKNVVFDDLNPNNFTQVGSTSNEKSVSIALENCTSGLKNLYYKFTGDADDIDDKLLKIKGNTGTSADGLATGLAIEILDPNRTPIPINLRKPLPWQNSSTYQFTFYLRYKSVSANVTSGDASSVLYLDMYYE